MHFKFEFSFLYEARIKQSQRKAREDAQKDMEQEDIKNIKSKTRKVTQNPGEQPVISYKDPSQIDPRVVARQKAIRKKKAEDARKSRLSPEEKKQRRQAAKQFEKESGTSKDKDEESFVKELEDTAASPRPMRKRRSDAKSFAQVKADIDIADAAKRAKKNR